LKTALKTHPQPTSWTDLLPIVLLGIRAQLKDDLKCTTAELAYDTTLRLPGEFFDNSNADLFPDPSSYGTKLKNMMIQLQPTLVRQQHKSKSYVSPHLTSCTHVFVRHDAVKKPLQKPYDGHFKVLKRSDKHFTLDMNGYEDVVSIDRLKPAFQDLTTTSEDSSSVDYTSPQLTVSPSKSTVTVTQSGRHVRCPKHLTSICTNHLGGVL